CHMKSRGYSLGGAGMRPSRDDYQSVTGMRMRALSILGGLAAGILILAGSFGAAFAQEQPQGDQTQMIEQLGEDSDQGSNPPGRVAQLSAAEGSVSLEPAGTDSWTSAALNRPLTLGDKLWTDENSRAELDIGDAVVRLGSATGFSFLNLDDQTAQMQVSAGTVIVHVRELSNGEQDEIDTPNLALTLQQPGTYRIEVSDSGDTTIVKVESGEALATVHGHEHARRRLREPRLPGRIRRLVDAARAADAAAGRGCAGIRSARHGWGG